MEIFDASVRLTHDDARDALFAYYGFRVRELVPRQALPRLLVVVVVLAVSYVAFIEGIPFPLRAVGVILFGAGAMFVVAACALLARYIAARIALARTFHDRRSSSGLVFDVHIDKRGLCVGSGSELRTFSWAQVGVILRADRVWVLTLRSGNFVPLPSASLPLELLDFISMYSGQSGCV
jgi:hypothetical protein